MKVLTIDQDWDSVVVLIERGDVELFLRQPGFPSQSHQVQHGVCRAANCILHNARQQYCGSLVSLQQCGEVRGARACTVTAFWKAFFVIMSRAVTPARSIVKVAATASTQS